MQRDIARLIDTQHDVVVVGGGIHGACAAWDAAQRGLRVALVEAGDFCNATSWNSLKTIHGGLRYLQSLDFRRMRESIRDRRAWLRIAPGLVRPLGFVVPANGYGKTGRHAFRAALGVNELISADRNHGVAADRRIPRGRVLAREEAISIVPGLSETRVDAAALWFDAQVASSERLVIALLRAACDSGAVLANYVKVVGMLRDGDRIVGVRAHDREAGADVSIRARVVLSAAGPSTDAILALAGIHRPPTPLLRAVNLVVQRRLLGSHAVGAAVGRRFLFMVPWGERTLVGTGYRPQAASDDDTLASELLAEARLAFPWADLSASDVALVHSGLVPGEGGAHGLWSHDQILDHARDGAEGLMSVLGVKLTTARAVAQAAIDRVCRRLDILATSRTSRIPLPWAWMPTGSVADMTRVAVTEEMALHASDVILRRAELGTAGPPEAAALDTVTATMAHLLDWDERRQAAEKESARERARQGIGSRPAENA